MARPQKNISAKQVEQLAGIGCTNEEIATLVECSVDTLVRRFAEVLKKGRETMKSSLRRFQYNSAKKGSVPMQIWLGKQYLNQRDKHDFDIRDVDAAIERELERLGAGSEDADASKAQGYSIN